MTKALDPAPPAAPRAPSRRPPAQAPRPWRSILEPHLEMIWGLRREGKTYREIAQVLANFGVHVSYTSVFKFVRARKRRILAAKLPDLPSERLRAAESRGAAGTAVPVSPVVVPAPQRARAEVAPVSVVPSAVPVPLPRPPLPTPKRILGADGKEIKNAQYAPANPDNL